MATPSGLRVSDADRESVATSLREHYADGRLSLEEFQQRLDATFAARTDHDLHRITNDLPHPTAFAPTWPPARRTVDRRGDNRRRRDGPHADGQFDSGSRHQSRRSAVGGYAYLNWLFITVALVFCAFGLFGALMPKPLIILLAILAFTRRIVRRIVGGGRCGPRGRR
jgi:hypothetical protein